MTRAFGIDISKWNTSTDGKITVNFDVIKAHSEKVIFIAARAGVSWSYEDPCFAYYWAEMDRIRVCRIAYHVPYFGESALAQMDFLFKILTNKVDWAHDNIALDLEVAGINTKGLITTTTLKCLEICKTRTGRYPIVYSRANWVDTYMNVAALPKLDWWLAQYRTALPSPLYTPEHPGPPRLPEGVSSYLIHQTGDRCKSIGSTARIYMDYNRWCGNNADVARYFGYSIFSDPKPEEDINPPPVEDEPIFQAKCIVGSLYKRSGPGISFPTVGYLVLGEVVNVYEERNDWYRIEKSEQVWCSGGAQYMQRL